jgi:glyoxylase-like metal-dependent hydrolase (beta-lactamase superfamily II)
VRPRFHVLCWGPVTRSARGSEAYEAFQTRFPALAGAGSIADARSTVGLLAYDTAQGERFMILDTGLAVQWPEIERGLRRHGCDDLNKITHVLQTHWDEDHFENITRFASHHPICIWGGSGPLHAPQHGRILVLGTGYYLETETIYPDGYVEDPAIRFYYAHRAHSRDEMYFVIDSENAGKVAFIGDLVHSPVAEQPVEFIVGRDRLYTLDPFRKIEVLRELRDRHPDVTAYYCGHARSPMSRPAFIENVAALEGPAYRPLLAELLAAGEATLSRYRAILDRLETGGAQPAATEGDRRCP